MSTSVTPPAAPTTSRRRLFGLRRTPGRLALALFRMPLNAYRHGSGWLLGHTFLAFTHVGRRTGLPYQAVAMVLRYDPETREAVIIAGWGPETDWVRNLRHGPAMQVQIARETYAPVHRFLTDDEAFAVVQEFRARHPFRVRLICAILGWGNLRNDANARAFIGAHPFVAFRPAPEA